MDILDTLFDEEPTYLELDKDEADVLNQYIECFGHGVPLAFIPHDFPRIELYKQMEECVNSGHDNLLERLGITVKRGRIY